MVCKPGSLVYEKLGHTTSFGKFKHLLRLNYHNNCTAFSEAESLLILKNIFVNTYFIQDGNGKTANLNNKDCLVIYVIWGFEICTYSIMCCLVNFASDKSAKQPDHILWILGYSNHNLLLFYLNLFGDRALSVV